MDIIARCEAYGINYERLKACLDQHDNWGDMVHSFEYLTVLGIVEDAMKERECSQVKESV
jgi:hypothetical protein